MKPIALITRYADPAVIEMLTSVCEVLPPVFLARGSHQQIAILGDCAQALLVATPERIDDGLLRHCRRLRVVACAFRVVEHVDIAACTRRGVWVTNVMARNPGLDAELEAARNILDAISGDTPRGALNEVLQPAA
jgi:phosphonate dehydrogenase